MTHSSQTPVPASKVEPPYAYNLASGNDDEPGPWYAVFSIPRDLRIFVAGEFSTAAEADAFGRHYRSERFDYHGWRNTIIPPYERIDDDIVIQAAGPRPPLPPPSGPRPIAGPVARVESIEQHEDGTMIIRLTDGS